MDPCARHFMWQVIHEISERRKRSLVVLTTHSMEEGEALCSKLAIQVDGVFRCFGSPQEVKCRHGTGYEVSVKFRPVEVLRHNQQETELAALAVSDWPRAGGFLRFD